MIDDGRLHVCGDLRVVRSDLVPHGTSRQTPNYFNGVLKIIPISPSIAIAYAGTIQIALNTIRAVKDAGYSSGEIADSLVKSLRDSGSIEECDFLVIDAAELVIYKVQGGKVSVTRNGRTWVGDNDAYNLFQAKLAELDYENAPNSIAKSSAMMNSLDAVIQNNTAISVGEFPIAAFSHNRELQLSVAFAAFGSSLPTKVGLNAMTFSNDVNDDSIIVNLCVPAERGIAAIGVYLNKFRRGAFYMPLVYDEPLVIEGGTIGEFRANVLKNYGVELLGGGFE